MAQLNKEYDLSIVLTGAGGVGKSAVTLQFLHNSFLDAYEPTIEESYSKHCVVDSVAAYVQIIDTAGQEEYEKLRDQSLSIGDCYLLVYDITNKSSFDELTKIRTSVLRLRNAETSGFPMVIIGNKCDLDSYRQVSKEEIKKRCLVWNVPFLESSAKARINIEEAFIECIRAVRKFKSRTANMTSSNATEQKPVKKMCCNVL